MCDFQPGSQQHLDRPISNRSGQLCPNLKRTFSPDGFGCQPLFDMILSSAVQALLLLAGGRLASAAPQSDLVGSDLIRSYSTLVVRSSLSPIPRAVL